MRHGHVLRASATIAALTACAALVGCASSREPRYFMLTGVPMPAIKPAAATPAQPERTVLLRPVLMPAYLERPQIVTRPTEHEIMASEFNRWGMPLENAATALLADVLTVELPGIFIETGSTPARPGAVTQVQVEIMRMDGSLGGDVNLMARWSVQESKDLAATVRRVSVFHQASEGAGYDAYVQAAGAAMELLAREIAGELRGLAPSAE